MKKKITEREVLAAAAAFEKVMAKPILKFTKADYAAGRKAQRVQMDFVRQRNREIEAMQKYTGSARIIRGGRF